VIGALELHPMTTPQLAHVLSANEASVRHYLEELKGMGLLRCVGRRKPVRCRPLKVWALPGVRG